MNKQHIIQGKIVVHKGVSVVSIPDGVVFKLDARDRELVVTHEEALQLHDLLGDVITWDDDEA